MKYTVTTTEATKQYNTAVKFFNNSYGSRRLNFSSFHKEIKQWAKHQGYSAKLYLRSAAIECINPAQPKEPECLLVDLIQLIANGQAYLIAIDILGLSENNLLFVLEEHAKLRKAIYVKAECLDDVIYEVDRKDYHHKNLHCIPNIKTLKSHMGDYSILFAPENLTWKTTHHEPSKQ
ncbi:MAG: hypothetical protein PHG38_08040 [Bacteroidales bacterium]|nr:hypothetical protein [Bacteroidales bacterium]